MKINFLKSLLILVLSFFLFSLSACNSNKKYDYSAKRTMPDVRYGTTYTVKRGDTLFSIAWVIKQDHRTVARWNKIKSPYLIKVGQRLRMYPPSSSKKSYKKSSSSKKSTHKHHSSSTKKAKSTKKSKKPVYKSSKQPTASVSRWRWPTKSRKIIARFNPSKGKDGVDINGRFGDSITAAADGQVVYAGSGLRGYGKLIILKHNKTYLSAYAHNQSILVKEGQNIKAGKKIGKMGDSGKGKAVLHFEIRKNGKPVNPSSYLSSR